MVFFEQLPTGEYQEVVSLNQGEIGLPLEPRQMVFRRAFCSCGVVYCECPPSRRRAWRRLQAELGEQR
jgi:hypothetical protein